MKPRVVITGMGICAPNGLSLQEFGDNLSQGISGIRHVPELENLKFGCQIAGYPLIEESYLNNYFTSLQQKGLKASGLIYGVIAGKDAWLDAGLSIKKEGEPDWNSGIIFGTGILGVDKFREAIYLVDQGQVRRLGSTSVVQTMASGISAYLGGILGCGNQVTTNSSACSTGTEGVIMAYDRIIQGKAKRILVGSCSDSGPYVWGGFDAMRILPRSFNDKPEAASRPMSATASGFVPASGAGALVLESLESAIDRNAKIYAEVLGGAVNSGGQRGGGSLTAPNSSSVQRCISEALQLTSVEPQALDTINGHLTATLKDPEEIRNWSLALDLSGEKFPYVNTFKSTIGHGLAAAGSMECVGAVLQLVRGEIFGNANCEDLHPDIEKVVARVRIPTETMAISPKIMAKASFGFGDVNACVIFRAFND